MALYPAAEKRLLAPGLNHSTGGMGAIHGVVVHVIVGSLAAADSVFHRPGWNASAHLGVGKDGRVIQWVDTKDKAWAEAAGNPSWVSVETEGYPTEPLTEAQLTAVAAIVKWVGGPLQVTDDPNGYGVGTHSMGGAAWGGHACPGGLRAAQRSEIVRLATGAPPPPPPAPTGPAPLPEDEDMSTFIRGNESPIVYELTAARMASVGSEATLNDLWAGNHGRTVPPAGWGTKTKVGAADVYVVAQRLVDELKPTYT